MAKLSLQEQMLKAGLVNEKKLKKAKKGSKKSRELAREIKSSVAENLTQQQERAKELNQQKKEQQQSKEIKAQVKQLIELNKIDTKHGDIKYNFTDGTLIKFVYVNAQIREQLVSGVLRIARYHNNGEDSYLVIPNTVAQKIIMRDPDAIVENNQQQSDEPDEDDPYKDFVVPDDLMW